MDVTKMVSLINTFSAQSCISVGKSGHERVDSYINIFCRNHSQSLLLTTIVINGLY